MNGMAEHAKPARRDHLWVLFVIAGCCLLEVWVSWVTIGSMSGFPKIGGRKGLPTDWTLAVTMEAYWGYALYAWLAAASGRRSRRFAMCSSAAVFILSLTGQGAAHLVKPGTQPPPVLVVFITALPVIVLALIAVLIHLRQLDREEAAETARAAVAAERMAEAERAEADERTALRAAVSDLRERLEGALSDAASARQEAAAARTRADELARKLAAVSARKSDQRPRKAPAKSAQRNAQDEDLANEVRALNLLLENPELRKPRMGGELARLLGVSPATGRRLHARLTAQDRPGESLTERSPGDADERSGERS